MAAMQEVHDIVMAYPAVSALGFTTPVNDTDPITPSFSNLDFGKVYGEFMTYLQQNGISANVPFAGMQQLTVWLQLVTLVWGSQTAGVS